MPVAVVAVLVFYGPLTHLRSFWVRSVNLATLTGPDRSVGRVSAPGNGRSRVRSGLRHTKVVNNGTSCSSLGTQTYGVELGLVDPVSG